MSQRSELGGAPEFLLAPEQGEDISPLRTPAGLQSSSTLLLRRSMMIGLCTVTLLAILLVVGPVFAPDGIDWLEAALIACVALSAPWTVLGFWNAMLGMALVVRRRGMLDAVAPQAAAYAEPTTTPLRARTAVAMAVRNEDVQRVFARLRAMRASLDATGEGDAFDIFVLSDTNDPEIAAEEEAAFARDLAALGGQTRAFYRRRPVNAGFKAGNIWDFLHTGGAPHTFFVPLDADSIMSGETIVRMVRVMEASPRLGILQSLAVGAPANGAFGRLFQFGMRHGMRAFTLGSAWWQGDCGPFWGHNAVIRSAAFRAHCALPELGGRPPFGGEILSHDQVEAALMRRGGYEVRVLPIESDSFEENPVTVLDFIRREQRWCNGNMQYARLLSTPDLRATSRFQLVQAMMMYLSAPAWMLLTALGALKAVVDPSWQFNGDLAVWLFFVVVGMSLTPKLAGALYVVFQPGEIARYGGGARFALGVAIETVFSMLMAPVVALHLTIFLVGLCFGRTGGWSGQIRDAYGLEWRTASRAFWPQMLFGVALLCALWIYAPAALLWGAPVILGLILAVPFAVFTASPALGRYLEDRRICAIPEEFALPDILSRAAAEGTGRQALAA